MATCEEILEGCKKCVHYSVCSSFSPEWFVYNHKENCKHFKDKSQFVEVARCKDCVFSREMDKYEKKLYLENCVGCTKHSTSYHSVIMKDNDFCSHGERRVEE